MHSHHQFPEMGLGCVHLTRENNEIIDHAIEAGCRLFDTADCYGNGESELALGEKLALYPALRSQLIVCTKVGVRMNADKTASINGSPSYIKFAVEASLKRLQLEYIDVVYLHRADPNVCIEESVTALKELVQAGKVKAIGLSEVTARMIGRAMQVHPIKFVQIEFSPWSRQDQYNRVIDTCHANNIKLIGCSPLGRGFFTNLEGEHFDALPENDYRKSLPRFQSNELKHNLEMRKVLEAFAAELNMTVAQLTLLWSMFHDIVPVPATTNIKHFDENFKATQLKLSAHEHHCLEEELHPIIYQGMRYLDDKQSGIYPAADVSFWHENRDAIRTGMKVLGLFAAVGVGAVVAHHVINKKGNSL